MTKRGYRTSESVWKKIADLKPEGYTILPLEDVYFVKMNSTCYLAICYYNLLEKYLCGGITNEDFSKITDNYYNLGDSNA